jgi:hypothetical protein
MEEPMRLDTLPAHAATKLLQLDADARQLAEEEEKLGDKIAFSRKVFSGQIEDPSLDVREMGNGFDALLAQKSATYDRQRAASHVLDACRKWVERLDDDVVLETAAVKVPDGAGLKMVQRRIAKAETEAAAIRRAPVVDPDIREKVEAYVPPRSKTA